MLPETLRDFYQIYFEALDFVIESIKTRFDQLGYRTYQKLQELPIKAGRGESFEEEYLFACSFYGDDIKSSCLW